MKSRFVVIAIALLLALPAVHAQDEGDQYTHLYGHMYDHGRPGGSPMNTVFPDGEEDYSYGNAIILFHADAAPEELPQVGSTCQGEDWQFFFQLGYGNCEPVHGFTYNEAWYYTYNAATKFSNKDEYDANGGLDALPGDLGLLKNAQFDATLPIEVDFWMSADATMWAALGNPFNEDIPFPYPPWNGDYGILPAMVIESKVFGHQPDPVLNLTREQIPGHLVEADLSGNATVLSTGVSDPFDMYSLPTTLSYDVIYRFEPAMSTPMVDTLPIGSEIWWWNDFTSRPMDGVKMMPGEGWAVNSGEFFPPRLSLPLANPMDIEMVMPQFTDDDKLVIIALFNSPFGSYDVPLDSATFEIITPDGQVITDQEDETVTWMQKAAREQQSLLGVSPEAAVARGQATWLWNYLAEPDIKPGDYTIRVRAENMQGKAAFKEAYFTIEEGLGKGAVTSSLGGMFTFSKEDIKQLEECHGCHDAATGDLLEGVQNVTMAEAKAMQAAGELDVDASGDASAEKKSPGIGVLAMLGALFIARRRKP